MGGALLLPLGRTLCVRLGGRGGRLPPEGGGVSTLQLEGAAITVRLDREAHQLHLRLRAQLALDVDHLARGHQLCFEARVALGLVGQRHLPHLLVDEAEQLDSQVAAHLREDGGLLAA